MYEYFCCSFLFKCVHLCKSLKYDNIILYNNNKENTFKIFDYKKRRGERKSVQEDLFYFRNHLLSLFVEIVLTFYV